MDIRLSRDYTNTISVAYHPDADKDGTGNIVPEHLKEGAVWRHFKGGLYEIISVGRYSEDHNRLMVVYRTVGDEDKVWVRDFDMFTSETDFAKYPDAKQKYRFEQVLEAGYKDGFAFYYTASDKYLDYKPSSDFPT